MEDVEGRVNVIKKIMLQFSKNQQNFKKKKCLHINTIFLKR